MSDGVETSARARVVIQFDDLGMWSSATTAEEIFRKASETVLQRLRDLVDEGHFQIVGEPEIDLVVGRRVR